MESHETLQNLLIDIIDHHWVYGEIVVLLVSAYLFYLLFKKRIDLRSCITIQFLLLAIEIIEFGNGARIKE